MKAPLKILHLEDDPNDAALIQSILEAEGFICAITCVQNRDEFVDALEESGGMDLILSDFSMPAFDGLSALKIAHTRCPDIPFILVSGTLGEERAIDALKCGATDYVLKQHLSRLVPAVHRALQEVKERMERKLAERKRSEYGSRLQVLSRRLVTAQETERRSIARELHDEIGQALTAMQLNLQALLQSAAASDRPRLRVTLETVERVLKQVHDLALNLRPSMLDDLGLEPALVWLTNRQAKIAGIKGEVHVGALEHRLDAVIETECFRITQEALTNVMRHAQARAVTVGLRQEAGQIHLRVQDDGIGFDVAAMSEKAVRGASLGLLSMEERAVLAGGQLEFNSVTGQGTEVHAWFPLKWRAA